MGGAQPVRRELDMADTPRVLVSLFDEGQEYQALQGAEARAAAHRLGLEAEVVFSSRDPARQRSQIEQALQAAEELRPRAVVVQAISIPALEPVAQAALQAGIGWVSLDPALYVSALQRAHPDGLVATLTTDSREMGRLQGRIFRALLPRGGNVVLLEGPATSSPVIDRREGLRDEVRGSGIQIAKTLYGDWSEASGEKAVALLVRLGRVARPDLIGAQNDTMALGARRAIETWKPEWRDLPITGCDGLPEGGQRMVREGILAATVVQPITAGAAVELVARSLRGEKVPLTQVLPPRTFPSVEELQHRALAPGAQR
jgi:ABC-type sugar transport system substrate-binding protein